jgi:hypothetical protein
MIILMPNNISQKRNVDFLRGESASVSSSVIPFSTGAFAEREWWLGERFDASNRRGQGVVHRKPPTSPRPVYAQRVIQLYRMCCFSFPFYLGHRSGVIAYPEPDASN